MAFEGDPTRWPRHLCCYVPRSDVLVALLNAAGPWVQRAGLPAAATKTGGESVTVLAHHAGAVADELGRALVRAREARTEGAGELAAVAAQFGVHEAAAEPQPEPEPATQDVPGQPPPAQDTPAPVPAPAGPSF